MQLPKSYDASPYYSKASFQPFMPLAVLYCFASRALSSVTRRLGRLPHPTDFVEPLRIGSVIREEDDVPVRFSPADDDPPVAVVTGSNTGIGYETAMELVRRGYTVVLACRSKDKAEAAAARIHSELLLQPTCGRAVFVAPLDLSSVRSVRDFCAAVRRKYPRGIHVLINNAGRNTSGPPSERGFDLLFQSNFLGHYVLTCGLLDLLLAASSTSTSSYKARVVNVSSVMHHFTRGPNLESESVWKSVIASGTSAAAAAAASKKESYSLSKLAAILFAIQLHRRYGDRIDSVAVNPGSVNSDIWRGYPRWLVFLFRLVYLTPKQGCRTSVVAATSARLTVSMENPNCDRLPPPLYLQPYRYRWTTSSALRRPGPLHPVCEMLGPYEECVVTPPRLPTDGGITASEALWEACSDATGCEWPPQAGKR